jgi:hypothetical protein
VLLLLAGCASPDTGGPARPAPTTTSVGPIPTAGTDGRAPGFPDTSDTGVPADVELTPSGSIVVDEPGAVFDGLDVAGTVTVRADDVIIRNTRIRTSSPIPVRVVGARNLVIEDSEIDGKGSAGPAIAFSGYTLRRVHIHDVTEGPRIAGGNVTIVDSLIDGLIHKGGRHTDVVQVVSGKNILLRRNTLQAFNPDQGTFGNAAFMFGEEEGEVRDCLVEGNLMNGGNFTVNGGGGGTTGASCVFRDNALGRDFRYGVVARLGPGSEWDDSNVWLDTGEPAP